MELMMATATIENVCNVNNVRAALIDLACIDGDFSGDNGADYVDEDILKLGYESNAEYYADEVIKDYVPDRLEDVLDEYVDAWMGHDTYYEGYKTDVTTVGNGAVVSLACVVD